MIISAVLALLKILHRLRATGQAGMAQVFISASLHVGSLFAMASESWDHLGSYPSQYFWAGLVLPHLYESLCHIKEVFSEVQLS